MPHDNNRINFFHHITQHFLHRINSTAQWVRLSLKLCQKEYLHFEILTTFYILSCVALTYLIFREKSNHIINKNLQEIKYWRVSWSFNSHFLWMSSYQFISNFFRFIYFPLFSLLHSRNQKRIIGAARGQQNIQPRHLMQRELYQINQNNVPILSPEYHWNLLMK